jgi:poly-gamma-glutamate synthesis protein (capsule biosynthesis protein)
MSARSLMLAALTGAVVLAPSSPARAQTPSVPGPGARWTLAAAGDAIITRRIAQFDHAGDPAFAAMAKVIRGADAATLNLELSLFDVQTFKGWPEVENGGNWEVGPPAVATDLKQMGFNLFARANNHTTDYGVEGMRVTNRLLNELEIVHAGSGENLGWASRPGYLETPKGRIALISLATTFTPMSRAGEARPEVPGRPGLNALRVTTRYEASPATLAALAEAAGAGSALGMTRPQPGQSVRLLGTTVYPGSEDRIVRQLNVQDTARILREIRNAADQADFVVVHGHSHEPGNSATAPDEWMREWVHACIDAGATTYVIHGPHQLRGIEIYRGRPIFYSLGNFVFQNETIDPMPTDHYEQYGLPHTALAKDLYDARFRGGTTGFPSNPVWYESVVAVPEFHGTEVVEIRLYPIDLGQTRPRSQRGTPRMADAATGRKIIERIAGQSAAFGTTIQYENGIGIWRKAS